SSLPQTRLRSGYEVVRINLLATAKGHSYTVLLAHLRQLSTMEVPHSPAFTRWSLASGLRMASREEEEQRWALLAGERFRPIANDFGDDYANLILLDRLRALGPPRTTRVLSREQLTRTAPGREQSRAIREVDGFLRSLTEDLGGPLRYSVEEVAEILDGALERLARDRFHTDLRELWSTG
ncbi:MAG: hypothetical protein ABI134_13925, partial [Byssovorax sp.]